LGWASLALDLYHGSIQPECAGNFGFEYELLSKEAGPGSLYLQFPILKKYTVSGFFSTQFSI